MSKDTPAGKCFPPRDHSNGPFGSYDLPRTGFRLVDSPNASAGAILYQFAEGSQVGKDGSTSKEHVYPEGSKAAIVAIHLGESSSATLYLDTGTDLDTLADLKTEDMTPMEKALKRFFDEQADESHPELVPEDCLPRKLGVRSIQHVRRAKIEILDGAGNPMETGRDLPADLGGLVTGRIIGPNDSLIGEGEGSFSVHWFEFKPHP